MTSVTFNHDPFTGIFSTWITKERPILRNFVISLSDATQNYLHHVFPNEPGEPVPLAPYPGTSPTWDNMGAYDDIAPEEKKQALAELNSQLSLWKVDIATCLREQQAMKKIKDYLDHFLSLDWRYALFPLNVDDYSLAGPLDVVEAINVYFAEQREDPNDASAVIKNKLATTPFVYADATSWRVFYADFQADLRLLKSYNIETVDDHHAANYLIDSVARCTQLANLPQYSTTMFTYRNNNREAGSREMHAVAHIVQQCLPLLPKQQTSRLNGYANAAASQEVDDEDPQDSDGLVLAATSAKAPRKNLKAAAVPAKVNRLAKPASAKPTIAPPQTTITITTSDPTAWQPLINQLSQQQRPNAAATAKAYSAAPAMYPKMYCYSCGTTTGAGRHFSQHCPATLRLPTHDESCNFRNWASCPGATPP